MKTALQLRSQPELRAEILLRRKSLDEQRHRHASEQISEALNTLLAQKKPRYVGSFASILGEPLLNIELPLERICYPRIEDEHIEFYHSDTHVSTFQKGRYAVPEPPLDLGRKVELNSEDVVLVPGVVFNLKGHRIGLGKGYYDRYLSKSEAQAWGVAFNFQIVKEEWSLQSWDRPVDVLVTEGFALDLSH